MLAFIVGSRRYPIRSCFYLTEESRTMTETPQLLGVCSWSLKPDSPESLAETLLRLEIPACQLALSPVVAGEPGWEHAVEILRDRGITILSAMMSTKGEDYSTLETIRQTGGLTPDATWPDNLEHAHRVAAFAQANGIALVTLHAGFLPHGAADPRYTIMVDRLRNVADCFADRGVKLGLETGQEHAGTLLGLLEVLDHPSVSVNFDPANMLLYGMGDPVDALRELAPRVCQVHIKDAVVTSEPGTWGQEVPVGEGAVDWAAFFLVMEEYGLDVNLIIEREAGPSREEDILTARDLVLAHVNARSAR